MYIVDNILIGQFYHRIFSGRWLVQPLCNMNMKFTLNMFMTIIIWNLYVIVLHQYFSYIHDENEHTPTYVKTTM